MLTVIAGEFIERNRAPQSDWRELAQELDQKLMALLETGVGTGLEPLHQFVDRVLIERENPVQGLHTGLRDFDKLVPRGLRPGDLAVIAARPSMGKSALLGQISDHAATQGMPVAVFSLEMSGSN